MDKTIKTKIDDLAKQVKENLGLDEGEVYKCWEDELALVKNLRADLSAVDQEKRAFLRLRGHWKRELRSPAKYFEGLIVRATPPIDVLRGARSEAQKLFEKNPEKAIREGFTDANGVPLEMRKVFSTGRPNPEYGKPLPEHRYIQSVMGVAKSDTMNVPMKFSLLLSERLAGKVAIPTFAPIKFRANPAKTQPTDGTLALNEYSGLQFKVTDIPGFPAPEEILEQFFGSETVPIEELKDWHKTNENNPRRMCFVEADVDDVDPVPNPSTGNARIVLTDEMGDMSVVVWVPEHLRPALDFGRGSRVIVSGRTALNIFNNEERLMINAEGIYAIPKYKIALDEESGKVVSKAEEVK